MGWKQVNATGDTKGTDLYGLWEIDSKSLRSPQIKIFEDRIRIQLKLWENMYFGAKVSKIGSIDRSKDYSTEVIKIYLTVHKTLRRPGKSILK